MQHFELLKEGVSRNALKLVCARRPKCMVRFQLEVVGAKLQIKCTQKKYEISGSEEDLMNVKNYGKLIHNHSQRCKSEFFYPRFFLTYFSQISKAVSAAPPHILLKTV